MVTEISSDVLVGNNGCNRSSYGFFWGSKVFIRSSQNVVEFELALLHLSNRLNLSIWCHLSSSRLWLLWLLLLDGLIKVLTLENSRTFDLLRGSIQITFI